MRGKKKKMFANSTDDAKMLRKLHCPARGPAEHTRTHPTTLRILTRQLVMDKFGKTGVVPPPEKPELPATRGVVPPPDTEHICSHASAEATQDGVLFCHREKDGRRGGTLPHKTPPFYASQISLRRTREKKNL